MLVLTRKIDQQILMDKGSIQIKILKVKDNVVSIGLHAPSHIDIDREEIYWKKLAQNAEGASA
jgi:carbon storage regulator